MTEPGGKRRAVALLVVMAVLAGTTLCARRAEPPPESSEKQGAGAGAAAGLASTAADNGEAALTGGEAAAEVEHADVAAGGVMPEQTLKAAEPGVVEADAFTMPYRDLEIAAEIGGVIAEVKVEEGNRVEGDQVLVLFKSDVLQARKNVQRLQVDAAEVQVKAEEANCAVATREFERAAGLFEQQIMTEKDYVKAQLDKDLADWRVRAAKATLDANQAGLILEDERLKQTVVRAPVAGQILRIAKRPGEAVDVYDPMLQMVCLDPLYVVTYVPIDTFGQIRPGMKAVLDMPRLNQRLACEVSVVDNVANVGSETYRVKLTLPNPDGAVAAGARGTIKFDLSK